VADQGGGFLRRLTRGMAAAVPLDDSDADLVRRFLSHRDPAVFETLVRRHGAMVYRVCWRILQHQQDAEDAFQATFLLLAADLRSLRRRASLAAFLHGVARRVALKARARAAARRRRERDTPPRAAEDPSWQELRAALDAELAALPERWRSPLVLCHLEGLTQDEAADRLGWSKGTLRRRLVEAREALGRRLRRAHADAHLAALASDCLGPPLPPALVDTTVAAATGGAVTEAVAALVAAGRPFAWLSWKLAALLAVALILATALLAAALTVTTGGESGQPARPSGTAAPDSP
jgi:RNA polymerase sigma factor (sigma-70 family)